MLEFYPTPPSLAEKMYAKFENKKIKRLLEPSAGRGALVEAVKERCKYHHSLTVDCVEIDLDNQAILRGKGFNVVGMDFLAFQGHALYSHAILNPPFSKGVEHVLKAWDIMFDGEIVAVINAESLRNLCTEKRKHLVRLIADHGSVEYLESAFESPDTARKTKVDIALIHLIKKADLELSFSELMKDLKKDGGATLSPETLNQEIAIRDGAIANYVRIFTIAVTTLKESCYAQEKAAYCKRLLTRETKSSHEPTAVDVMAESFNDKYLDLKRLAWDSVFHCTDFSKHLSSGAYGKLRSEFGTVVDLEFTESNIRGFLIGLIENKATYNIQMMLDVFDEISKFHSDNRAYYKGFKSNDKHRENAFRIKTTRFILPWAKHHGHCFYYEVLQKLADFDKCFAQLDGKLEAPTSLYYVADKHFSRLCSGERLSSSYFDLRFYPGAQTLHFYPRDKKLIDRLNRYVGQHRHWLPNEGKASQSFWKQYENADKVTDMMNKNSRNFPSVSRWAAQEEKAEAIDKIHAAACEELGYDLSHFELLEDAA